MLLKQTFRIGAICLCVLFLGIFSGSAFAAKPFCGNDICEGNESKTCSQDCDAPPPDIPGETASCGCGGGLPSFQARAGRTYVRDLVIPSNPTTKYEVRLPSNYDVNSLSGFPVILYLHGWGGNHRALPARFSRFAKDNGLIAVTPSGYGDGGRNSWNGFRSAKLPNCLSNEGFTKAGYSDTDCEAGPSSGPSTCVDLNNSGFDYCYESCGDCPKWDGQDDNDNTWNVVPDEFNGDYTCYWTTCRDSVAQIETLLDEIERDYCVDRSMIWVTGCSNGGMFVYELAKDFRTSERFAGYLPQVGSPHPGFVQENLTLPSNPKYFMGFWGKTDTTVPPVANFGSGVDGEVALDTNFNGWLYMSADSIVEQWVDMNNLNLEDDLYPYDASAYSSSLDCRAWPDEGDAEIIRCYFQGGHSCPGFGNMPQMMWDFAKDRQKEVTTAECL